MPFAEKLKAARCDGHFVNHAFPFSDENNAGRNVSANLRFIVTITFKSLGDVAQPALGFRISGLQRGWHGSATYQQAT